jgi:uncharacterized cupredoxin-like copper-binding protein
MNPVLRSTFALIAVAAALLLAGCSSHSHSHSAEGAAGGVQAAPDVEYTLEMRMNGYRGKGGSIDGLRNPTLTARPGQVVKITILNAESMPHDIELKQHGVKSKPLFRNGEQTSITFVARESESYICSIPGHVQTGMIGQFQLLEPGPALADASR